MRPLLFSLLTILALFSTVSGKMHRFKTLVEAGNVDCFTINIEEQSVGVTASYMVISADSTHDIHVDIRGAQNSYNIKERKQRAIHTFNAAQGEMSLCLDNSYSFTTDKMVAVSVHVNNDEPKEQSTADKVTQAANSIQRALKLAANEMYDRTNVEGMHRTIVENNFESINFWGIVNSIAMILSALVQVYMIRRLLK